MAKLRQIWTALHSSLWFVPSLLVGGSIMLAVVLIEIDSVLSWELATSYPRLFGAGAEGSRGILQAVAGSMITVAGVTFSITIVALSLASSQYSPRILRNFMSDRSNQVVLGVFVGIFTYCLIVLRTIRGGDEDGFVPSLSVLFSLLLALIGIGFLIFFIHHIASSIQSSSVITSAANQTMRAVDRLFSQDLREDEPDDDADVERTIEGAKWQAVPAHKTGYIQSVEMDSLLRFACERQTIVRMERGVGDFIVEGFALASVTRNDALDEADTKRLNNFYVISSNRTVEQDVSFGIIQIVDIALKALSPGINDTTTAITCLDYISAILARLAGRRIEMPYRFDEGELRIITKEQDFDAFLSIAFNQIGENAGGKVAVIMRMLEAIETTAAATKNPVRRLALMKHIVLMAEMAERTVESSHDRARIEESVARARVGLELSA